MSPENTEMPNQPRRRRIPKLMPVSSNQALALLLLLLPNLFLLQSASAATNIDLTTEYSILSKTSAVTSRSTKSKILSSSSSAAAAAATAAVRAGGGGGASVNSGAASPTINSNSNNRAAAPSAADVENSELGTGIEHTLIAVSSKSYISPPTSPPPPPQAGPQPPPKLTKRAGNLADLKELKHKKIIKDHRNRSRISPQNEKLLNSNVPDHLPDASAHFPYRTGRPLLPSTDYSSGAGTISSGSGGGGGGGYRSNPYESEKRNEYWDRDYSSQLGFNSTKVQHIEAECQDDYMKLRIGFNGTFSGLVYSAGYAYDPDCMYINGSGRDYYEFYIQLNRCGTLGKNALHEENRKNPTNFMWNTVTVQYNPLIEEEYDEHFKVTCEYGYDFWKTVTFPFLDVEVATGNPVVFTLSPPECNMEIQNGYGIGGPRVTGPVRVGDPLTLIIYMRSKYDGFDIVVNDCYAHNGATKRIQLIDDYGCPVDDKLISRFRGSWSDTGVFETQVYAYMKTFRFTGSPALYIECDVRMCHGRCPSQPCHWRNLKAITKRDLSNSSSLPAPPLADFPDVTEKPDAPLSENVNLFQSLRVLQEGESDGDDVYSQARHLLEPSVHQTCLKTTTFSAMTATFSAMLCILSAALMIACSRLKHRSKQSSLYDSYITHKGQID